MMQSINTHFRLSASHTDRIDVICSSNNSRNEQISDVRKVKTAIIVDRICNRSR